ncbi:hypothetical protein AYO42_02505 [Rhizomicrobium sp. SCGC AG-212-E05]|nr:hypothetical protein AYO42_02505 [Rhizomicrobium sp. SCGC AG-212-E05]
MKSVAEPAVPAVKPASQAVKSSAARKPAIKKKQAVRKKATRKAAARKAKPKPAQSLAITVKPPNDAPDFDFTDRIEQAQALAARAPVLPGDMVVDGGDLSRFVWTLVVGKKTGPLTVVRMDQKGNNDKGLNITWRIDNFLNTRFQVADGYIVFAQRRPVRVKGAWEPAVYTAYAPELDTAKMRAHGMEYLRLQERRSYNYLQSHDVRSRVAPEDTVAETIPRSMVLRLMITEHIDPARMKYVGIEQCIHEVLITVAANREKAYAYARSSAGALGIVQFIEPSYHMVRENYPRAPLEPHFDTAMRDLRNAAMATVLHLDLQLAHLPADYLKRFTDSSYHLAAYLAAGYNRNTVKVVRTYRRTRTFTGGDTPYENKMYVRIQDWVGGYLKRKYDIS